jgi:HSP20 family molecular chaperone IbpA
MAIRRRRSIWEIVDDYFSDTERWADKFEDIYAERPSWNLRDSSIEPLREIAVTPTEVFVTIDLPFTKKVDVKVKPIGTSSIEITAKMNRTFKLNDLGVTHTEGVFRKYHSHLHIPVPVNMKKMVVGYKKGILEIHLPRKR